MKRILTLSLLAALLLTLSACTGVLAGVDAKEQLPATSGNFFDQALTLEYGELLTLQDRLSQLTPEDVDFLEGYLWGVMDRQACSGYKTLRLCVPEETIGQLFSPDILGAYVALDEARDTFMTVLQENLDAPALVDPDSAFRQALPALHDAILQADYDARFQEEDWQVEACVRDVQALADTLVALSELVTA